MTEGDAHENTDGGVNNTVHGRLSIAGLWQGANGLECEDDKVLETTYDTASLQGIREEPYCERQGGESKYIPQTLEIFVVAKF